jgi:hypothetical protein
MSYRSSRNIKIDHDNLTITRSQFRDNSVDRFNTVRLNTERNYRVDDIKKEYYVVN